MKTLAPSLQRAAQEGKRKQSVRMWKTGRYTHREIGEQIGVHYFTVGRWIKKYQDGGTKALQARTRGRREGSGRRMTQEQEAMIQKQLIDKTPDQLKLRYALWTR